jgi:hypothetical protein
MIGGLVGLLASAIKIPTACKCLLPVKAVLGRRHKKAHTSGEAVSGVWANNIL